MAAVRELPAGSFVSYGRTARLEEDTRVAVLPVGYGDGFFRLLSNRGAVLLGGKECPILGRVCMDLCMVRADDAVRPGDEAVLFGPDYPIETMADQVGTIQYELLCDVNRRVPRIYRE